MNNAIPSKQESLKLFKEFVLFSNVEKHCVSVATVATYLAKKMNEQKNANLNLDLTFAAALFHDLAKASQIPTLEPKKFNFTPLTPEQEQRWQVLRDVSLSITALFNELNKIYPSLNKKIHETDVAAIIIGAAFPALLPYIHQIGGTRDEIYFSAGWEIKLTHYADWTLHISDLVPLETRLDYLFKTYADSLTPEQISDRKKREKALEKELFNGLDVSANLDTAELNNLKRELFNGEYDFFKIGKTHIID